MVHPASGLCTVKVQPSLRRHLFAKSKSTNKGRWLVQKDAIRLRRGPYKHLRIRLNNRIASANESTPVAISFCPYDNIGARDVHICDGRVSGRNEKPSCSVDQFRIFATGAVMFEDFHAWLGILLWPNLVVFIGFASAVHLVINLGCIFFGLGYFSVPRSSNGAAPGEKQPVAGKILNSPANKKA